MSLDTRKSILLVEDEALIAMNEKAHLERRGYSVTVVGKGEQAVEAARQGKGIDLILMDIDLGKGMDGTEAAEAILRGRDVPIVFLSSHAEPEIVEKTEKITSYGYVVKNSSITVLDASIKMAFRLFQARIAERQKEKELSDRGQFLQSILQTTVDGFWIADAERRFVEVNDACLRMSGYSRDDFLRLALGDIVSEEARAETLRRLDQIEANAFANFETKHRRKDGSVFDAEMSVTLAASEGGRYICFCRDITARKQVYEVLLQSEQKYRDLFNNAEVGMFRTLLDGSKVLEFNEKYLSILGRTREECEGMPSSIFWAEPEKRADMVRILESQGHVEDFECDLIRKDGRTVTCVTSLRLYPEQGILEGSILDITESKWIEDALAAKESQFRSVLDAMSEGFMGLEVLADEAGDPRDIRILEANRAFELLTGLSRKDACGHTMLELFPSFAGPWVELCGRVARVGESESFTASFGRLGKSFRASAFRTEGSRLGALLRDVDETPKSLEALRESEMMYRSFVENSNNILFCVNSEGEYRFANTVFAQAFGKTPDYFVGKTFLDVYPQGDADARYRIVKEVFESGQGASFEIAVPIRGKMLYYSSKANPIKDGSGRVMLVLVNGIDITARKQAEEDLRREEERLNESEYKYHSYMANSPYGIFVTDEKGNYLEVNDAACELTGYDRQELLGMSLAELLPGRVSVAEVESFGELSGKGVLKVEKQFRHKDGSLHWFSIDAVKLSETRRISFCKDISERKDAESRIARLLAEKESLLMEVHHRIKNNMGTMESLLELQAGAIREPSAIQALKDAANRLRSMGLLYDKLYRSKNFEKVSARDYFPSLVAEVVSVFPNGGTVEEKIDVEDFSLGPKEMSTLGIIVNEAITNSMKHAFPNGGRGLIRLSASKARGTVSLSIGDDGVGMPSGIDFGRANGFGLLLIETLASQLNGSVRIERNGGTNIVLDFPSNDEL